MVPKIPASQLHLLKDQLAAAVRVYLIEVNATQELAASFSVRSINRLTPAAWEAQLAREEEVFRGVQQMKENLTTLLNSLRGPV